MLLRVLHKSLLFGSLMIVSGVTLQSADAPDEFAQMIVKLIGDHDKEFRAAGLEQVRIAARGPAFTQLFASQLPKLDAGGQVALLDALADRGDRTARSSVLDLLSSSHDQTVRAAAIHALGRLGTSEDLPLLIKSLSAG